MRRIAVALVSVLAFAAIYFWCIVPWRCNQVTKVMESAMRDALAGSDESREVLRSGLAEAEAFRSRIPDNANLNIVVASTYTMLGRYDEALAVYESALRFDRRPEMYFNRAGIRLRLNDAEGAMSDYIRAVRFNPTLLRRIHDETVRERIETDLARIRSGALP